MPAEQHVHVFPLTSPDNLLAYRFIEQSNAPVFVTGKAGTGKTNFLRYVRQHIQKNYAVVAPTAVAAINAGGVTLHSFFQVPRGPLVPGSHQFNYSSEKLQLLKCLELLIIDEISMVRSDALDYMDQSLRFARGSERPFGGIQLLMVGDLYQLPPVYEKDWPILKNYYRTPFFFSAMSLASTQPVTFEFKEIHRQSDPIFIDVLNGVRNGHAGADLLATLNKRYLKDFTDDGACTTLTTHNAVVASINQEHLDILSGETFTFKAVINGDFPKDGFPADELLVLKAGAQVMFIKNDASGKKQYYNGRKAIVTAIGVSQVRVRFLDDETELELVPEIWQHIKYNLVAAAEKVTESNAGTFTQYPIKLAWAITVHKSQGLTFDRVVIDVEKAFAHGQTYVALSRCRTLEGIILRAPVKPENLLTNPEIIGFMQKVTENVPDETLLIRCINDFQNGLIKEIFDFSYIGRQWLLLKPLFMDEPVDAQTAWKHGQKILTEQLVPIGARFIRKDLAESDQMSTKPEVLERMAKAAAFFMAPAEALAAVCHSLFTLVRDELLFSALNTLLSNLSLKVVLLRKDFGNLKPDELVATAHQQAISFKPFSKGKTLVKSEKEVVNPQLYAMLLEWRKSYSEAQSVPDYTIVSEKLLKAIAAKEPRTVQELAAINGIGEQKAASIGPDIIALFAAQRGEQSLF